MPHFNNTTGVQQHSRPTNNQLLYKAHFRWKHYTAELEPGTELPVGTEACASVTSAFLQILATIHNVEACRVSKPRNILNILSTNTRRTKVVEMSTGTHRVADDLRRHSLSDGQGGQYGTNLDRNRYGSDNNYLFTVTKYNLESLGLCPCLVDVEIVDTRNGNEANIVTVGPDACSCASEERLALADNTFLAAGGQNVVGVPAEKKRKVVENKPRQKKPMRRSASYQNVANSGSELFDALLMAATHTHTQEKDVQHDREGEAPVSSRQRSARMRSARGGWGSFTDFFSNDDDSKPNMMRRNSVSMIMDNPVLAQTGAGESLLVNPNHSDQGDTEMQQGDNIADEDQNVSSQVARFHKQSSAVNLARLAGGSSEAHRRLVSEVKQLREERHKLELALEESKSAQKQAEKNAEEAKAAARKASDIAVALRKAAEKSGIELDEELVESSKYLPTSEQEINLLKAELDELKKKSAAFDPKKAMNMLSQMPYAMNMLPMFGMPPLNPFGGISSPNNSQSSIPKMLKAGMMQKVASMPAMHGLVAHNTVSPAATAGQKASEEVAVSTKQEENI